jgi:hypothetical protein
MCPHFRRVSLGRFHAHSLDRPVAAPNLNFLPPPVVREIGEGLASRGKLPVREKVCASGRTHSLVALPQTPAFAIGMASSARWTSKIDSSSVDVPAVNPTIENDRSASASSSAAVVT